jgi:hypothetical protein
MTGAYRADALMRPRSLLIPILLSVATIVLHFAGSTAIADEKNPPMASAEDHPTPSTEFRTAPGEHLLAFVGRKITVREVRRPGRMRMDAEFQARYQVLGVVYGHYPESQIEFTAFDHFGSPQFARYETVMLYLSQHEGTYYHQKYLFQAVYPTNDGRWAGCGDPYLDMPSGHRHGVRAEPVLFSPPVTFPVAGLTEAEIAARYPTPYYARDGGAVRCVYGNYAAELFRVMAEGFLSARGVLRAEPHKKPLQPDGASPRR